MKLSALVAFTTGLLLLASPLLPGADSATSCRKKANNATIAPKPSTLAPKTATPHILPSTSPGSIATDASITGSAALLDFAAKADGLYLNGAKFTIKGANYFGMEGGILAPNGLWGGDNSTSLAAIAATLKKKNFNAVRLTLTVDAVLDNKVVDLDMVKNEATLTNKYNANTNPLLYLDLLDHVVDVLAQNKLLVLLNAHMLVADKGISELWYTSASNADWLENAWTILAKRYKNAWNVLGADLKNEPHGAATWGSGDTTTDWRLASLQMATSIHAITDKWLIFVEGMDKSSQDDAATPCFWGENLMDVQKAPLVLSVAERLVYSPHVYGPDVSNMSYFHASNYPNNLPAIWDAHFGYITKDAATYGGPIVVGEWGGKYRSAADKQWQNAFAAYLKENSLSWFYWAVNPNGGDTEGLFEDDWVTLRVDKIDTLLADFVGSTVP